VAQTQTRIRVQTSAERAAESRRFIMPNPGDMMMMMVFGWALFCFFLVTLGNKVLIGLARLAKNDIYRNMLLESGEVIGLIMLVGSVLLVITIALAYRYPRIFLPFMLYSLVFANAGWKPVHDLTWIIKYLGVIYLGALTVMFFYKNVWRLVSIPYIRLVIAYLVWVGGVAVLVGGRTEDIWYAATEAVFFLGFSIAWLFVFSNRYGLEEFNKLIAWTAVVVTLTHMGAPFLMSKYIDQGRFTSYFPRATVFAFVFTPFIISMFWMSMAHKNERIRIFFLGCSSVAMLLLLWSGSRGPTGGVVIAVGILWLFFRSRALLVTFFLGALVVATQLIFSLGSNVETSALASRLQSADTGRVDLWLGLLPATFESPIYGLAPSDMRYIIVAQEKAAYLATLGRDVSGNTGIHNSYLGTALRFGYVGLALFVALIVFAMKRGYEVLMSKRVPAHEKRIYILPVAMLPAISFQAIFEDYIPGSGKGTVMSIVFYASMLISQVYGTRLLNEYERVGKSGFKLSTVEGLNLVPHSEKA
jgi:O-antigen ligase